MTNTGYYAILARPESSKAVAVKLVKRAYTGTSYKETDLIGWTVVPTNPSKMGVELSVQAVGGEISIFVNGQEVKTARDETYNQGLVGFVLSGPGRATFKALEVKQIA